MNLSEEEIIEIIKTYYSDINSQYAILLNGEWGCGKTYFVKNKILAKINDSVYVSLYGLSNTSDISKKILYSIMNKNMKINNPEENAVKFYANMFFYYSVYDGATDKTKAKCQFAYMLDKIVEEMKQ